VQPEIVATAILLTQTFFGWYYIKEYQFCKIFAKKKLATSSSFSTPKTFLSH